ncbi:MAG: hypothetical protein ACE5FF_10095 [Saprospiraceae bacterium]
MLLTTFACKKNQVPTDDGELINPIVTPSGEAHSLINGTPWEYLAYISKRQDFPDKFVFDLNRYNDNGLKRGEMSFKNVTLKTGTFYPVQWVYVHGSVDTIFSCSFITLLGEGDPGGDQYVLLKDSAMVFTLDKIETNGEIWGTFSGTLVKKIGEMEYDPASPDTLVFTEGEYHAKLEP